MYSLIQELKREGTLKLYHDYRSGSARDFSGNGHDGTPTQLEWMNNHLEATGALPRVDLTYNADLLLPNGGSLIILPYWVDSQGNADIYFNAADAGGNQYNFYFSGGSGGSLLYIQSGAGSVRTTNAVNTQEGYPYDQCYGVTFEGGVTPTIYVNGIAQAMTVSVAWPATLYQTADTVRIGASRPLGSPTGVLQAAIITSTKLTATQHSQIYGELMR